MTVHTPEWLADPTVEFTFKVYFHGQLDAVVAVFQQAQRLGLSAKIDASSFEKSATVKVSATHNGEVDFEGALVALKEIHEHARTQRLI